MAKVLAAVVSGPGQQTSLVGSGSNFEPRVYYNKDHDGFWRFCAVAAVVLGIIFGGGWFFETGIWNQNYGFCVTPLCDWVTRTTVQAEVNRLAAPPAPIVVPPPPPAPTVVFAPAPQPPQVIMQQPSAPNIIMVPAPQQNCCGAHWGPIGRPTGYARPAQAYPYCNSPYVGGFPNACRPVRRYGHPGIAGLIGGIAGSWLQRRLF